MNFKYVIAWIMIEISMVALMNCDIFDSLDECDVYDSLDYDCDIYRSLDYDCDTYGSLDLWLWYLW